METITRNMPVLALRGLTAFPGQTMSFDAERDISIFALDNAMENDRRLLAVTQRELSTAEPGEEELYTIVDYGCTVVDVIVEHPLYGELVGQLHLSSRYDVDRFMDSIRESEPLSQLTHGVHLHTIRYPDEEAFAKMKEALREKGILYPQKIG